MKNDRSSETAIRAWARLARAAARLQAGIEDALKTARLPPLAWYDVLFELQRAKPVGLRQFEIGSRTLLPKYNLSRLLDKLESEALVRREACEEDGRGNVVRITDAGTALLKRMWVIYGAEIEGRVGSKLSPDEQVSLAVMLGKLGGAPESES